jgi:hypothetical protein
MTQLCDACHKNPAHYVVRISDQTLCIWCYKALPIPQDGKIYQTTDWSTVVVQ